ncbi:MAG: hypothetical protein R3D34_04980 [Nitratireductor sp.]
MNIGKRLQVALAGRFNEKSGSVPEFPDHCKPCQPVFNFAIAGLV